MLTGVCRAYVVGSHLEFTIAEGHGLPSEGAGSRAWIQGTPTKVDRHVQYGHLRACVGLALWSTFGKTTKVVQASPPRSVHPGHVKLKRCCPDAHEVYRPSFCPRGGGAASGGLMRPTVTCTRCRPDTTLKFTFLVAHCSLSAQVYCRMAPLWSPY
jgi:hypothetical protein